MKKKKGSALALTLIVLAILMVLVSTLFVVGLANNKIINANDNSNKLNIIAESGVEVALAQVKKATTASSLTDITGLKSTDRTINCDVKFYLGKEYNPSTKVYDTVTGKDTIESTASNSKGTKTIRVVLSEVWHPYTGVVPTNNLFYISGAVTASNFNGLTANGDIFVDGNFYMSSNSSISGKLISTGNISLTAASSSNNGIICFGNVELGSGANVNGDSLIKGDLTYNGGAVLKGKAQVDGNLYMTKGNGSIEKDAIIGKSVSLSGNASIGGNLYYQGSLNPNNVSSYVKGTVTKTTNYTPVDLSSYQAASLPTIKIPTAIENPQLYNNVTLTNKTIKSSGRFPDAAFTGNLFKSVASGSIITIDTSTSDISLLINNFNFDPENKLNFVVSGAHNLYIYLTGNSAAFTEGTQQFIGMLDHSVPSQIFIFGDGNQKVSISGCELDANIYIPNGSFTAGGSTLDTYIFQGTCTTKTVNLNGQKSLNYSKPNITGTPLDPLNNGGGGGSTISFSVDKWYY
jgi:hypothetical protein